MLKCYGLQQNQSRTVVCHRPRPCLHRRQRSRTASQMRCSRLLRLRQCQARQHPAIAASSSTAPIAGQARPSAEPLPNGLYSVRCGARPSVSAVTSSACAADSVGTHTHSELKARTGQIYVLPEPCSGRQNDIQPVHCSKSGMSQRRVAQR